MTEKELEEKKERLRKLGFKVDVPVSEALGTKDLRGKCISFTGIGRPHKITKL